MRVVRSWFVFPLVFGLAACEMSSTSRQELPSYPNGKITARADALKDPNDYRVKLNWSGIRPASIELFRTEGGGKKRVLTKILSESGEYWDEDVLAGETYEYRVRAGGHSVPSTTIRVPLDYVADRPGAYQPGIIVGYNRLFLGTMISSGPVRIEVNEIISLNNDFDPKVKGSNWCGEIYAWGAPYFKKRLAPDGENGRDGQSVFIRAKRLKGRMNVETPGQNGGKGDTRGGISGPVSIEIDEKLNYANPVRVWVQRALHGNYVGTVGTEEKRLASMAPILVKAESKAYFTATQDALPLETIGLFQGKKDPFLVTSDGLYYDIETNADEIAIKNPRSLLQDGFMLSDGSIHIADTGWRPAINPQVVQSSILKALVSTVKATARLRHAMAPDFRVSIPIPQTLREVDGTRERLVLGLAASANAFISYLRRNEFTDVRVDLASQDSFKRDKGTFVVPGGVERPVAEIVALMEADRLPLEEIE